MRTILYLRDEEKNLFDKLPTALKASWEDKIAEETLDSYEAEEALTDQMANPPYKNDPRFVSWLEKHANDENPADSMQDFPEDLMPACLENLGACGLCTMIESILHSGRLDERGMEAVAAMSVLRHNILTKNAVAA